MTTATEYTVTLRQPHPRQADFVDSEAKRIIVRAGRRGGKTVGVAIRAVHRFLAGRRQLYGSPTQEQVDAFWWEVKRALASLIDSGVLYKNESLHIIEFPGTKQRIRAKTAWNADTLRGDYADDLYLDEWQLMNEDTWGRVGAPMLADTDGDAVFIYTPPSIRARGVSKAQDPLHAAKMFKAAQQDITGRWACFHFASAENPHISQEALSELASDMTNLAYRQEILAEDIEEVPGALWRYNMFQRAKVPAPQELSRIVVAIDPAVSSAQSADETGIVVAALAKDQRHYVLSDVSGHYSPDTWARRAVAEYEDWKADRVVGEVNNGGEMVGHTLRTVARAVSYKAVHASRGKAARAEPVAALYEQGKVLHCGRFNELEEQLISWVPGMGKSPSRLDALVWALTELSQGSRLSMDRPLSGRYGRDQGVIERLGW